MKPTGYLTQCDAGGRPMSNPCSNTTRLEKPARWRCEHCTRLYGPVSAVAK